MGRKKKLVRQERFFDKDIWEKQEFPDVEWVSDIYVKKSFRGCSEEVIDIELKKCYKKELEELKPYFNEMKEYDLEHNKLIIVNFEHKVVFAKTINSGTAHSISVDTADFIRIIDKVVKKYGDNIKVYYIHNHPTAKPLPSDQDLFIINLLYTSLKHSVYCNCYGDSYIIARKYPDIWSSKSSEYIKRLDKRLDSIFSVDKNAEEDKLMYLGEVKKGGIYIEQ